MHRWIQISVTESLKLDEEEAVTKGSGYQYDTDGGAMVEYHIDSADIFQKRMKGTKYGGNLSVQRDINEKPLIIMGHDECIFKQYLLTKKNWTGPDGEIALVPKDEGQGVMISALQSREFGLGMALSDDDLKRINERRKGEMYMDKDAAKKRNGSPFKKPLSTSNPFYIEFEYGANKEGYWNYKLTVL